MNRSFEGIIVHWVDGTHPTLRRAAISFRPSTGGTAAELGKHVDESLKNFCGDDWLSSCSAFTTDSPAVMVKLETVRG